MIKDIIEKFKGHLRIELIDKNGKIVDLFDDPNMIMDTARQNMAQAMSGSTAFSPINKVVLATEGHGTDILTPKTGDDGFIKERTELFGETSNTYSYNIEFTPPVTGSGVCTIVAEDDVNETPSEITQTLTNYDTTYLINIPIASANSPEGAVIYTEAALYAGSKIFSMKTFKGKIKDDSVSIRITWKISY